MLAKCRHMICTQKIDKLCIVFYQLLLPSLALVSPKRWESKPCKLIIYLVDLVPQAMNKLFSSLFIEMWDFFFFFWDNRIIKPKLTWIHGLPALFFQRNHHSQLWKKTSPHEVKKSLSPCMVCWCSLPGAGLSWIEGRGWSPGGTETVTACCHSQCLSL